MNNNNRRNSIRRNSLIAALNSVENKDISLDEHPIEAYVGTSMDQHSVPCLILYIPSMKIQMQFSQDYEFQSISAVELFKRNSSNLYTEIRISFEWIDELFGLYDQKVHLEFEMQAVAQKLQDKLPAHIIHRLHQ